jgi:hypothetical protein
MHRAANEDRGPQMLALRRLSRGRRPPPAETLHLLLSQRIFWKLLTRSLESQNFHSPPAVATTLLCAVPLLVAELVFFQLIQQCSVAYF